LLQILYYLFITDLDQVKETTDVIIPKYKNNIEVYSVVFDLH